MKEGRKEDEGKKIKVGRKDGRTDERKGGRKEDEGRRMKVGR